MVSVSSTGTSSPGGWAVRAHDACDALVWLALVNVLWLAGTLAGGVVLGLAPASVAAAAVSRRRLRGETGGTARAFARTWRAELARSNAVLLPVLLAGLLLLANWRVFAGREGAAADAVAAATALAGLALAAVAVVLLPLYVHYDLPLRRYLPTAASFLLANPVAALLPLLGVVVVLAVTRALPGLALFLSAAALLHLVTALALGTFERNDERVNARATAG